MTAEIEIEVAYLARLREAFGTASEKLSAAEGATAGQMLETLRARGDREQLNWKNLRAVVGGRVVDWDHPLADGDTLEILPPITGG